HTRPTASAHAVYDSPLRIYAYSLFFYLLRPPPISTLFPYTTLFRSRVPSVQLVPMERYRAQMRKQFLRGVLLGIGIYAVVMIPIFRYAGSTKPGSPARTTASANRAAQSSAEQTQASVAQPASPRASTSEPTATKPLATEPATVQTVSVAAPTRSPQRQSPQIAGASSTDL